MKALNLNKFTRRTNIIIINKLLKVLKPILTYFLWVIGFTIIVGTILFFIPLVNLLNVLIITIFLCIPLFAIFLIGLIKGKIKILKIHTRRSLLFRSTIFMSCLVIFLLLGLGESVMADLLMSDYNRANVTNTEKMEFIKELAKKNSLNKISKEYIVSLDSMSPNNRLKVHYSMEDKELADKLVKAIPDIETQLNKMFPVKEPFPLEIVLYNNLDHFINNNDIAENQRILGLYSNKSIHLANAKVSEEIYKNSTLELDLKSMNYEQEILHTLEHEFTHYYIRAYLTENKLNPEIPRWLDEGLAVYYESQGYKSDIEFDFLNLKGSAIPLQDLTSQVEWEKNTQSEAASDIAYNESFMVVYELIKSKGATIITDILSEIPEDQGLTINDQTLFSKSFFNHVGLSIEEFQDQVILKYSK